DVAAEQRLRLAGERRLQSGSQRADGDEGADAEGDAGEQRGEVPAAPARLTPGETQRDRDRTGPSGFATGPAGVGRHGTTLHAGRGRRGPPPASEAKRES